MVSTRRLVPADADVFRALRIEAFTLESANFGSTPASAAAMPHTDIEARLAREHVVGLFAEDGLAGLGGLDCLVGERHAHKARIWGMYLRAAHRGSGAANLIMGGLLDAARKRVEIVQLTVVASNGRALRFYERLGFRTYGVEIAALKHPDGSYSDEALMALRLA